MKNTAALNVLHHASQNQQFLAQKKSLQYICNFVSYSETNFVKVKHENSRKRFAKDSVVPLLSALLSGEKTNIVLFCSLGRYLRSKS